MKIITDVLNPFKRLYGILPSSSRRRLVLVVAISLLAALFETASVASILPFMAVVMDPDIISNYPSVEKVLTWIGVTSSAGAVIVAGVLTVVILALGNSISALNLWSQTRYIAVERKDLSSELFKGYMHLPYAFHVQRDSASLGRVMGADVESALGGFLASLLGVVSKGLSGIVLICLIIVVDPFVALGTVLVLGGGYYWVYRMIREQQSKLGARMIEVGEKIGRASREGIAALKEVRVLGREATAISLYDDSLKILTETQASNLLAAALPRYFIEVFAYAGIVIVTLIFVLKGEGASAVPSLALYALAGNRLVPIFQQFFAAAITIKYHTKAVAALEDDLALVRKHMSGDQHETKEAITFSSSIELKNIEFKYIGASKSALKNVTLNIAKNQSVGFVGRTGSGKTTLADIILGLFQPSEGGIYIDGVKLTEKNERAWRKRVGYVPQHVFLTNATIANNIALGVPVNEVDEDAIKHAAKMAQAHDFIEQLPEAYDTIVGERGVKLSGGQRQRLGIARALYHNPDVLVFDEATSALDGMTEDAVMEAVQSLSSNRTMILIAHRLRTVQACDRIIMLESGEVVADGSYDELIKNSFQFQKLAGYVESK